MYNELYYDIFANCSLPCNKCTRFNYTFLNCYWLICKRHSEFEPTLYYLIASNNYLDINRFFTHFKFEYKNVFYLVRNQQVYRHKLDNLPSILNKLKQNEHYYYDN